MSKPLSTMSRFGWTTNCPQSCRFGLLRVLAILRPLQILSPFSEVSKRGWRTEGVGAKKSFLHQRLRPPFLHPFSYAPLREGGHISGEVLGLSFGGLFVTNPLPPTPFRNLFRCQMMEAFLCPVRTGNNGF